MWGFQSSYYQYICAAVIFAAAGCGANYHGKTTASLNLESQHEAEAPVLSAHLEKENIILKEPINFASSSDTILEDSYPILDDVSTILKKHDEISLVHIEGHTDTRGGSFYNKKLSEKRALSVAQYLGEKGVKQRLQTHGFGEEQIVCRQDTLSCHAQNRRVEFRVEKH
ncbi:MAG: OmpA family protein [Myxococcales bacterium]|nr:MAG: OmpA family protein [Myxococcales bacterium]